jgi:hypothetical protein
MERKAQHDHPLPKESQIYVKKTAINQLLGSKKKKLKK